MESTRQQKIRKAIMLIGNVSQDEWKEFWKLAGADKERMLSLLKSAYTEKPKDVRKKEIEKTLNEIGVNFTNNGYKYLVMAISLYMDNNTLYSSVKKLYMDISAYYGKAYLSVERCIRWAIASTWERMSLEQKNEIFPQFINLKKGKPTNKEFIKCIAEMLE